MFERLKRLFRRRKPILIAEVTVPENVTSMEFTTPSYRELTKMLRNRTIAKKNEERQKATMGYGLKPRNFKPRPHHEVKTWDLQAKPNDTYMPCDKGKNADCGHCDVGAPWSDIKKCPYGKHPLPKADA